MSPASRSPASSGLLPLPGSPSSSWAVYRARVSSLFQNGGVLAFVAFWLFGVINNVLYVIILSAAQDLVGSDVPKGVVLLVDVLPSFLAKLIAPYTFLPMSYSVRVIFFAALSSLGMLIIALTPPEKSVGAKMAGVILASFSSGAGETSFLGLTHYYGHVSLAAWGSGTGAAGLVGAGLYVLLTDWIGFSVRDSLFASAFLPVVMLLSFFVVLPRRPLREAAKARQYEPVLEVDDETEADDIDDIPTADAASSLLAPAPTTSTAHGTSRPDLRRASALFLPYMLPLLLVYVAEYTINQGVSPTLLFPLASSPFSEYRDFYPMYTFLYQLGVFISRTSIAFVRIHRLYLPSLLQVGNLVLLTLHSLMNFIPNVYIIFLITFWEGLLGGGVYVNTFAAIMENVPMQDREFSLSVTSVSDSGGICIAALLGIILEPWLCNHQVRQGRDWCRKIEVG